MATQQAKDLNAQVIEVTDQSKSNLARVAVLTAYASKYIGGIVVLVLTVLVLVHLHIRLRARHDREVAAHAVTQTKLATLSEAHTDLLKTVNQSINPPTP